MAFLRTGFVALLLICTAYTSQPLESARDQYKAHEDVLHSPQLLSEATDNAADVRRFFKIKPVEDNKDVKKQEVHDDVQTPSSKSHGSLKKPEDPRHKRHIDFIGGYSLNSNYYSTWNPAVPSIIPVPPLSSFSVYQPAVYQLSRPYYIPLWGAPGKIPLYFPPQPVYINAGYPVDNPPNKGYLPPNGYLPPDTNTPSTPTNTTLMPTDNRFNTDAPVWGQVPNGRPTTTAAPTRRPRPPGPRTTTFPPLIHNEDTSESSAMNPSGSMAAQRPPPASNIVPPPVSQNRPSGGRQPSRCVWAIISCCSASSAEISYSCFEQLGCTGAFWDSSPCESDFARAAIANVINYYNTK